MRQNCWYFVCLLSRVPCDYQSLSRRSAKRAGGRIHLSWNNKLPLITVALIATLSVPSLAHAQRGHGGGRAVARPVIVAPYYAPFYSPFYSPYYDPFFWGLGWGYPGWYGPYNGVVVEESSARIQVTPKQTEVYVDGYLAGVVDDFDGTTQRLRVSPGEHVIDLYLDGHKPVTQTVLFQQGKTIRIKHTMEQLASGEAAPARPAPKPGAAAPNQRGQYDAFGQPISGGGPVNAANASATLAIRVQPGDASVIVDGERWQSSGDRLEIHVSPGEHRIEVQKDGYQPFATTVRVKAGDNAPMNVSLTKSGEK